MSRLPRRPKVHSEEFNEEVLDRMLFGTQEIDCPRMELTRNSPVKPCVFKGPGYVRRDETGNLLFKVYPAESPEGFRFQDEWTGASQAGQLIDKSMHYRLMATDFVSQTWTSDYILPNFTTGPAGMMVHGHLREVRSEKTLRFPVRSRPYLRLVFLEDVDLPCNAATEITIARGGEDDSRSSSSLNLAKSSSCGFDFTLRTEPDELVAEIEAVECDMPAQLESRVIESLQFVLAQSLHCRVSEHITVSTSAIRVAAARQLSPKTTMPPPLHLLSVQAHGPLNCVYSLFDRYLRFILPHEGPDWHACSVFIYKAREASANSPDARALGIAVSVEGLTSLLHRSIGSPSSEFKAAVKALKRFVQTWPGIPDWAGDASLRARLPGLIDQLSRVRAADRLYLLAEQGYIDVRLVEAWKALRNPMAHAETPDPIERQGFYNRIMAATVLLYQLVFAAIQYDGFYTDYAVFGFPSKKYPLGSDV